MKCQILFSWKNKKNINLASVEFAQRVVPVHIIEVTAFTICILLYSRFFVCPFLSQNNLLQLCPTKNK